MYAIYFIGINPLKKTKLIGNFQARTTSSRIKSSNKKSNNIGPDKLIKNIRSLPR
jgi:hypothetical protein